MMNYKSILELNDSQAFQPYFYIEKNGEGRRLVIGDIHGCPLTFHALLDKVGLNKTDQLFLLGDFINKGRNGKEVIDIILQLIDNEYQLFPLRGNHEQMLLDKHWKKADWESALPSIFRAGGILDENKKILPEYLPFFSHLPYYYELDNCYIVHGGFDFTTEKPLEEYDKILWIREFKIDNQIVKHKRIIHGHTPELFMLIKQDIENRSQKICIDNGCVYKSKWFLGNLLCLDLDSFELFEQENIENEHLH
jgi:serine/threonine protein phosphatase 1